MAVPGTGAITMLGVAQERKYGTYGSGTISSPITMFDLLNGGGANAFPALNQCPQPNTPSYSMSGWYGYNQTASCSSCKEVEAFYDREDPFSACISEPVVLFSSSTNLSAPWEEGVPFYEDPACSQPAPGGWYSNREEVAYWDDKAGKWTIIELCTF
jgi:hypothetical protein